MKSYLWRIGLSIALCIGLVAPVMAEMAVPPVPRDGWVLDNTNTLSPEQTRLLNTSIAEYRQSTGVQLAVLIVPTIENDYLENFSINVARTWGIGEKDKNNGALLLIAMRDKTMRIEVGTGLEGDLTDSRAGRIIRERITPEFRSGNYFAGIESGINGMKLAINATEDPKTTESPLKNQDVLSILAFGAYMFIFVLSWFSSMLGRSKRWWPGGLLGGVLGAGMGGLISGLLTIAIISGFVVAVFGFLFDYLVSKNYKKAVQNDSTPSWWAGGGWGGGFGGGSSGGFGGGFGGGGFSGGGSSGSW